MDKQNYTIKGIKAQEIKREFSKIRKAIIRAVRDRGIIQRKRVIREAAVLVDASYLYIVEKLSYQRLSDEMACRYGIRMSDTSWKKQLRKIAEIFLDVVTQHMQKCLTQSLSTTQQTLLNYQKVYAADATDISQEGSQNTVMRIHTQLSLNNHAGVRMRITDNHTAENISLLPIEEQSLYLADRAYGKARQLAHLADNQADFIIRITPNRLNVYADKECRQRIDFPSLLSEPITSFSMHAFFRYSGHTYPIRIIGEKLPEEKQSDAEKRVRKKAAKNRNKLQESTILFSKWLIVASTVNDSVAGREILAAYRQRWQIELLFKRSKTLLGLKKCLFLHFSTKLPFSTFGAPLSLLFPRSISSAFLPEIS